MARTMEDLLYVTVRYEREAGRDVEDGFGIAFIRDAVVFHLEFLSRESEKEGGVMSLG